MGCVASTPSDRKRTRSADAKVIKDKATGTCEGRQEKQVAQVLATSVIDDDGGAPPPVGLRKTYGPDGYELVGQLGAGKTGTMKLMRNRRTKELVVARCIPHHATGAFNPLAVQQCMLHFFFLMRNSTYVITSASKRVSHRVLF
jgi:hypothetical protein